MKKINNCQGITLVETIIYLTLVSMVLVSILSYSQHVISSKNKSQTIQEVQQNSRFALERLAQEIRSSQGVNADSTLTGDLVNGGFLHLDQGLEPDDNDDKYFQITNNILTVKTGSTGVEENLISNQLKVDKLIITEIKNSSTKKSYKIEMQISYNNQSGWAEFDWSTNLQDTITIRK